MKNVKITICLVVAVLFMATCQGFGLSVEFKDGGTHNIDYQIGGDTPWLVENVLVDYQAPGMQTTVNLLAGGEIANGEWLVDDPYEHPSWHPYWHDLIGYSDSRINISGGRVTNLYAHGSSQVTTSGGSVDELCAYDSSQATMSGGSITWLCTYDSSQVTRSNGGVCGLYAHGSSQVTTSGGSVDELCAYDSSQVTMSGGAMWGLFAEGSSQVTMSDGSVDELCAYDSSQVTMSGGYVGYLLTNASSQTNWSGGTIGGDINISETATVTIYGSNFAIDGVSIEGSILQLNDYVSPNPYESRHLTGTLANGDIINNDFIPEPATLLLLGLGAVIIKRKSKIKNQK